MRVKTDGDILTFQQGDGTTVSVNLQKTDRVVCKHNPYLQSNCNAYDVSTSNMPLEAYKNTPDSVKPVKWLMRQCVIAELPDAARTQQKQQAKKERAACASYLDYSGGWFKSSKTKNAERELLFNRWQTEKLKVSTIHHDIVEPAREQQRTRNAEVWEKWCADLEQDPFYAITNIVLKQDDGAFIDLEVKRWYGLEEKIPLSDPYGPEWQPIHEMIIDAWKYATRKS